MKTNKDNTWDVSKPQLQEVDLFNQTSSPDYQSPTDLEFIMTKSAFGYQYALEALEKMDGRDFHSEQALIEVDNFKQSYFLARKKLKAMDHERLTKLEEELRIQKLSVFGMKQNYLH